MDKYLPPIRSLRPTGRIFTASVVLGTCLAVTSFTPQLATAQSEARGPAVEESHGGGHD
ncbi:MAG: hypothetical protein JO117_07435, partial [Verrucomicrobia bacterium]|nr:hypothetical protein [Verrucomicrobiota bacterium]